MFLFLLSLNSEGAFLTLMQRRMPHNKNRNSTEKIAIMVMRNLRFEFKKKSCMYHIYYIIYVFRNQEIILAIRDYLILGLVHSLRTTLDHWKISEIQKKIIIIITTNTRVFLLTFSVKCTYVLWKSGPTSLTDTGRPSGRQLFARLSLKSINQ